MERYLAVLYHFSRFAHRVFLSGTLFSLAHVDRVWETSASERVAAFQPSVEWIGAVMDTADCRFLPARGDAVGRPELTSRVT